MSEWFNSINHSPDKSGAWLFAISYDYSGVDVIRWSDHDDGWVNASGEGNLFGSEEFDIVYAMWSLAPSWLVTFADRAWQKEQRDSKVKKYGHE